MTRFDESLLCEVEYPDGSIGWADCFRRDFRAVSSALIADGALSVSARPGDGPFLVASSPLPWPSGS
jgi:hypothetical protein